jgi:hypothetical protein
MKPFSIHPHHDHRYGAAGKIVFGAEAVSNRNKDLQAADGRTTDYPTQAVSPLELHNLARVKPEVIFASAPRSVTHAL